VTGCSSAGRPASPAASASRRVGPGEADAVAGFDVAAEADGLVDAEPPEFGPAPPWESAALPEAPPCSAAVLLGVSTACIRSPPVVCVAPPSR
jgi:hypothetical protein